MSPLAK